MDYLHGFGLPSETAKRFGKDSLPDHLIKTLLRRDRIVRLK